MVYQSYCELSYSYILDFPILATAESGVDYEALDEVVTLMQGEARPCFDIVTIDDVAVEASENIIVSLTEENGVTLGISNIQIAIADNGDCKCFSLILIQQGDTHEILRNCYITSTAICDLFQSHLLCNIYLRFLSKFSHSYAKCNQWSLLSILPVVTLEYMSTALSGSEGDVVSVCVEVRNGSVQGLSLSAELTVADNTTSGM